jgi:transcription elongation factor GreB
MGRWKPPPPKSSPYITPEGYEALQEELKELWLRRRDVVKALAAAAAEGDRSENAEYIYRKKELGSIDYRIRYLQKRLPNLNVVRESPDANKIYFGAWVILESIETADLTIEYRIVGPDETDGQKQWISIDSPLARAMLKKATDDEVSVTVAGQRTDYLVTGIRYQ